MTPSTNLLTASSKDLRKKREDNAAHRQQWKQAAAAVAAAALAQITQSSTAVTPHANENASISFNEPSPFRKTTEDQS